MQSKRSESMDVDVVHVTMRKTVAKGDGESDEDPFDNLWDSVRWRRQGMLEIVGLYN